MALLRDVWANTRNLYERFDVYPPRTEPAWDYLEQEFTELSEEVFRNQNPPAEIAAEMADVIVTLLGVLMSCGGEYSHLENALRAVQDKNRVKDWKTHTVVDGQIMRRDKLKVVVDE